MNPEIEQHEKGFILSFIVKAKQERMLSMLPNIKTRKKIVKQLSHFRDFDTDKIKRLAKGSHTSEYVFTYLKSKGAPDTCYVISESEELDNRFLVLSDALTKIISCDMGTVVSCVPGKLAYYEGEDDRFFLQQ